MFERVARITRARKSPQAASQPMVIWSGRQPAGNAYEQSMQRILTESGPLPVDDLANRVGSEILQHELERGAWALEIATWGPGYFRDEARAIIDAAIGKSLDRWPAPESAGAGTFGETLAH